ncbi:MAG TPA: hypothetical protein VGW40_06055 [Allosphingosinicella sp.]|nr:hypothetical protein [Allosphingosinicella sp.]
MTDNQSPAFIHVVGRVNLAEMTGKIDYVVPATSGSQHQSEAADEQIRLDVRDKDKNVLDSVAAVLRRPSCDGGVAQYGLIQENLPRVEGMTEVVLRIGEKVVDRYAPSVPGLAAAVTAAFASVAGAVGLGSMFPSQSRRRRSYTVQVRRGGDENWQTIAVDSPTPDVDVDAGQFPDAERLYSRVLESDGFGWKVIRDGEVALARAQPGAGAVL